MNYKRRDAAPRGRLKQIFCTIPRSHPFIIRHELLMKNQWKRNPTSLYKTVCLSVLIHVCFWVSVWQGWGEDTLGCFWGQRPLRLRSTSCQRTACHLDMLFTRLLPFFNATLERDIPWKNCVFSSSALLKRDVMPVKHQTELLQNNNNRE